MIRVVIYLIVLLALAYGGMLLIQNPGHFSVDWYGHVINTTAVLGIAAIAIAAIVAWIVLRIVFGLPSFLAYASRRSRREKGYAELSRGLIAVHSGDVRGASSASAKASRHLKSDALALMLRAQAAHLAGNGGDARKAYEELAERDDTRVLGLRGLYAEANRSGDDEAARHFAAAAHRTSPLPWSAEAVLGHRASDQDWETALKTVESSVAAKLVDKETGERQRAVLETALAQQQEMSAPDKALSLARSAMKRAPDLAPPIVVAAALLTRQGDIRKASRLIEKAWPRCQHPDIARAYLDVRPGDSTSDRLARAKMLMGLSAFDPVARMAVARAAIATKDFDTARSAMEPLVGQGKRPTIKMCMLMAELEENEHGNAGHAREWQARATHAALDPAWVADGIVYEDWAPISPTTGRLDAFNWQVPVERMGRVMDAMPAHAPPARSFPADPAPPLVQHEEAAMLLPPESTPSATATTAPAAATQSSAAQAETGPVEAAPGDAALVASEPIATPGPPRVVQAEGLAAAPRSTTAADAPAQPIVAPTASSADGIAAVEGLAPVRDEPRGMEPSDPDDASEADSRSWYRPPLDPRLYRRNGVLRSG